jgi:hypothetical protein
MPYDPVRSALLLANVRQKRSSLIAACIDRRYAEALGTSPPKTRETRAGRRFRDDADQWLAESDPRYAGGRKARGY